MEILDSVNDQILNNELKHREHPGIIKPRTVEQPPWLYKTIQIILQDKGISSVAIGESGQKLIAHLHGRRMPPERRDMQLKLKEICSRTVNYDAYTSLSYLISRSVPEYSVLYKLFNEIKTRDDNFIPKTLFDFGSGVGTVIWAASQFWTKSIKEYYCVDASPDMNDLSEYLLKRSNTRINISDVFYKQFLPVSANRTYDIVVSAYSLLELPNQISRLEVIGRLWRITERYLVIVEQGTKCGFDIINEAREFILMYNKIKGHVFSPVSI
ncbi:Methyltransferase-like protein 17, mitochondrial [Dufourea novaeangliae]|uniref:Methyltransferase-like protein 17, mitochondrial n=1 Tax=Dufourea novaeangliae TaxID=178035 RepID=A0A154NYJ5_DUFNO|nr:Methyltransferase-like protein 17, mitochondrial [Dufourea novaeangliae]